MPITPRNLAIPVALALCSAVTMTIARSQTAAPGAPPDIIGLRPGMTPQEAYNALKAHNPSAGISIGQTHVPELSEKPIPLYMSLGGPGTEAPEIITVGLTLPPNKQQVWGILRQVQYRQDQEILAATAEKGLIQKYGQTWPEHMTIGWNFWAFDEQGMPVVESQALKRSNCAAQTLFDLPVGRRDTPMYDVGVPLPIVQKATDPCAALVTVKAQFQGGSRNDTIRQIGVLLVDNPLAMRSWQAYQAFIANAGSAREKKEQQDLKQRAAPKF